MIVLINKVMADNNEIMDRREDVMTSLLRGRTTREIIKVVGHSHGVSKATVERDISHCYDEIKRKYERELPKVISTHIAKYEEIHKAAMELGDFKSAIAALGAIEKLLKLHVQQPLVALQQNNMTIDLSGYSLEELQKILTSNNNDS